MRYPPHSVIFRYIHRIYGGIQLSGDLEYEKEYFNPRDCRRKEANIPGNTSAKSTLTHVLCVTSEIHLLMISHFLPYPCVTGAVNPAYLTAALLRSLGSISKIQSIGSLVDSCFFRVMLFVSVKWETTHAAFLYRADIII